METFDLHRKRMVHPGEATDRINIIVNITQCFRSSVMGRYETGVNAEATASLNVL